MDRLLQIARRMQHRDVFGIAPALHAESAAEIVGDDVQLLRLDVHRAGNLRPHAGEALSGAAQREFVGLGVVVRRRRARFERSDDQTLVHQLDFHDMRGVLEGALERRLLFSISIGGRGPVKTDIAGGVGPAKPSY